MTMPLHFSSTGNSKSRPLLLLHGFMGCGEDWRKVADHFAARRFCILPDLPGHGGSPAAASPGEYSISATVRRLASLLDGLGVDKVDLAGYSLGGRIALRMALTMPRRIGRLVLESASPGLESSGEREQRLSADRVLAERLRAGDLEKFIDDWYRLPLFQSLRKDPELLGNLRRRRLNNRPEGLALSLEGAGTGVMEPLWSRLGELELPVMLACGRLDRKFVTINSKMAGLIPRAHLHLFDDVGHNVHLERPAEFIEELNRFLLRRDQDGS